VRDDEAVRRFVERMAALLAEWGFPRMAGRVLMVMMAADEESLTAAELGERLGVSPAAISGALRYLTQLRMVVREPVPGSRRDRYRMPNDVWYEVGLGEVPMFKTLAQLADDGVAALGGTGNPAGARMARMREFYQFMQKELPTLLERWKAEHPD
jgi:DNA-binding transcriptional ArsR family regulator